MKHDLWGQGSYFLALLLVCIFEGPRQNNNNSTSCLKFPRSQMTPNQSVLQENCQKPLKTHAYMSGKAFPQFTLLTIVFKRVAKSNILFKKCQAPIRQFKRYVSWNSFLTVLFVLSRLTNIPKHGPRYI